MCREFWYATSMPKRKCLRNEIKNKQNLAILKISHVSAQAALFEEMYVTL